MRIVANKNKNSKKKFPWRIILDNGRNIQFQARYNFKIYLLGHMAAGSVLCGITRFRGVKKKI